MEEDEDYEALFFAECADLLGDLQEQLDRIADGDEDPETINAAFRAVHSVKGGAAAFGFTDLIGFAHIFETVMDGIRSGRLEATPDLAMILVRAGDAMAHLVELASQGGGEPEAIVPRVKAELEEVAAQLGAEAAPKPQPEPEPAAESASQMGEAASREIRIRFAPGPDFFARGHDPLRIFRAARELGLMSAEVEGEAPPLSDLSFEACPFVWTLTFDTDRPDAEIDAFFDVCADAASIERLDGETPTDPPAPTEPAARKQPTPQPAASAKKSGGGVARSLRVDLARVDKLVNLVGEIVITQAVLAQKLAEIDGAMTLEAGHSLEALNRQTRELQESVMTIRAQPVKSVFSRMPRIVRDLSETLGKRARLVISGENTEVDTTVIEELTEPLTHMLRNSMDHGLESAEERRAAGKPEEGVIHLSAEHRGERVIIQITDDGRGIDRDRVLAKAMERGLVGPGESLTPEEIDALIFHPGFSTSEKVSSVSGRGVGMDVVKKKIQSLGGRCTVRSEPGKGTEFTITLPLTLAVLDGMTIRVGSERFVLPLSSVIEAVRLEDCDVREMHDGSRMIGVRGAYLRLISLRKTLGLPPADAPETMAVVADTETDGHVALLVDELIGQRHVVLKSLETNFKRIDGVSGATILGDGRVALILDVPSLASLGLPRRTMQQETVH
ncbi:chemotaxis protein CheA [Oceanicella actignis]|uniref:Chemotaxis protein CheA n=1 Tax=Oceanicella actignis TaxID=1189325 RepID=A0A1M7T5K2_9RHOB|nr:chemotaxis protein CheA [Oceanicella actignis]SET43361.1 two-component system, chemotaxis family, sensor kinase CheA [Oceanicella actignis]SHN65968.1 two-component system, chemotaxis family, sensor kinase CheA [Oceanicella actignis]